MSSPDLRTDDPSDTITELEFTLTDDSYFFVGLSSEQSCQVRLEEMIQLIDGSLIEFFTASGSTAEAIRERGEQTDPVDSVRIVDERNGEIVFRLAIPDQCIAQTLEGAGAILQSIRANDGDGRATVLVPRGIDARSVADSMLNQHPTSELTAYRSREIPAPVFTAQGWQQLVQNRLTDRQWEVLRTAYRAGYWDRPRDQTGEEIADELGISNATFSQHIRSACRSLCAVLYDRDARTDD